MRSYLLITLLASSYLIPPLCFADTLSAKKQTFQIQGIIVSSSCDVSVHGKNVSNDILDFGTINMGDKPSNHTEYFSIQLSDIDTPIGCSAFLASKNAVRFSFGKPNGGELDAQGVITRGAGDKIRIAISPTDKQASSKDVISSKHRVVTYPWQFATKGLFNFKAIPLGVDKASAGSYEGTLTLNITYK